jgi:segregation and condensation protein A
MPYEVKTPVFSGPLELLLHLIEREELEITGLSMTQITGQFLDYVAAMPERSADELADFLVMAARLIWIKSRALLPRPPQALPDEDEEDLAEQLARQLREYKRFRDVASWLGNLEAVGSRSYIRVAPPPDGSKRLAPGEIKWEDVLEALTQALVAVDDSEPAVSMVLPVQVNVADQVTRILKATRRGATVTFRHLLTGATSRLEIIVTLLALLELIRRGSIHVMQTTLFGEIAISGDGQGKPDPVSVPL